MAYDDACKELAQQDPAAFASWLLGRPIPETALLPTELGIDPIRADSVVFLETPGTIVHVEFQTTYASDPPLPLRMADYYIRLLHRHRSPPREVEQFVVLLTCPPENTAIEEEFRTGQMVHRYQVVRLWEQDPALLLKQPALMPLAALARTDRPEQLLVRVAERIATIEAPGPRANILAYAKILAGLRFAEAIIDELLREELMRESVIYQRILREGEVEGMQKLLLRLLTHRFGQIPSEVVNQIETINESGQLERLSELVLDVANLKQFCQQL